jgi:hexosaminidase
MNKHRIFRLAGLLLLALSVWGCRTAGDFSFEQLAVSWELDGNVTQDEKTTHTATFRFTNKGEHRLGDKGWALYWNQAPRMVTGNNGKLRVENLGGDFYRLTPLEGFSLKPGQTAEMSYTSNSWLIKESDGPRGLFFAQQRGGQDTTVVVKDFSLQPFTRPEQYNRSPADQVPLPDAEWLFAQNERLRSLPSTQYDPFVPAPASWKRGLGDFVLPEKTSISCPAALADEARYLANELYSRFGIAAFPQINGQGGHIHLSISSSITEPEAYRLSVDRDKGVVVEAGGDAGIFYGVQSVLSLVKKANGARYELPDCEIEDQPAFAYRGLHIDVSRNFQSKETMLRMIDLMAQYKLNKLLFYLTEDEGWRLEIRGLPELTEVGARRGFLHRDSLYLQPAYGSGPDPDDSESHGNGYYSREAYIEMIRYARERHIDIIPMVNLPGHARAAIKAMELRYDRLMAEGKPEEAARYRLIDPADTSRYLSAQGYFDNTACVCQEQVYHFFEWVLDDIIAIYREAGAPLRMMHTGGDEVPATAFTGSPVCQAFLAQHPEIKNTRNLQAMFFGRINELIRARGLETGAWEEAVMLFEGDGSWKPNPAYVDKQVYPYIWNSVWGNQDLGYRLANEGYPVILSNVSNFYFDLAYTKDPREPGLYWAGFVDTEDAYSFVPYNLYETTRVDDMGRPYKPEVDFAGMQRLTEAGRENIVGLQAQLWSETIKGRGMLEYYTLPKLFGFAQRAWQGQPDWSGQGEEARLAGWNRFMNTVARVELPRLDSWKGGFNYRLPPPGVRLEDGKIKMNSAYIGYTIRFTTDGSEPDSQSRRYTGPFTYTGVQIKAACFDERGRMGLVTDWKPGE